MDLYAENILDHYREPRHHGKLESATVSAADANPLCGDKIEIGLRLKDGLIEEATFTGEGCAISQAGASMLMEEIQGKSLEEIFKIANEDVYEMLGVPLTTARVKCALLGFVTLKKAAMQVNLN